MKVIKGNSLVELFKNVNQWIGNGKIIKSIDVSVSESNFYSHQARIKTEDDEAKNDFS